MSLGFAGPRERIKIGRELEHAIPSGPASDTAAATALLVYSKVAESDPVETKRTKLIVASIESAVTDFVTREHSPWETPLRQRVGQAGARWGRRQPPTWHKRSKPKDCLPQWV